LQNNWIIGVLFASAIVASCHNGKETGTVKAVNDEKSEPKDEDKITAVGVTVGYVRDLSEKNTCGFMIEVRNEQGNIQWLEPLSLDEKYQVDGYKLTFTYTVSKRPSICSAMFSIPIVIDSIIE